MVWEQIVLAGLAGVDAYAFVKYVESARAIGAVTGKQSKQSAIVGNGSTVASSPAKLSARLEAIKMAVGDAASEEGPKAFSSSLASDTTVYSSSKAEFDEEAPEDEKQQADTRDYDLRAEFPSHASLDERFRFLLSAIEQHDEAIRKLNSDFSSIDERMEQLDSRFSGKETTATPAIRIPLVKKARKIRAG